MQRGRGGGDPFFGFGDPFSSFGGFGGSGGGRSLMSNFFGGRDPFDDPFFTRPLGGSMFESSFFGPPGATPFSNMHQNAFIEHQPPQPKRLRGPIIEELNSDDEKEQAAEDRNENHRKHGRSSHEPVVEEPDDEVEGSEIRHPQHRNDYSVAQHQPQTHCFSFSSSTVTYGGADGAYYTSSKTRRTGSDGLTIEESKEADTSKREAKHRVSRALRNKGHSVTRKLNSDGKVDTMQTLHNLNEDELGGFEETWSGNARNILPGWTGGFIGQNEMGSGSRAQNEHAGRGGWALPSTERSQNPRRLVSDGSGSSDKHHSGLMKKSTNVKENMPYPRGRSGDKV